MKSRVFFSPGLPANPLAILLIRLMAASLFLLIEGAGEKFGEEGFEKMVEKVAGIEKALGIYDLNQFTPKS